MNGATAWTPASARAGSRCSQVRAVSGNPCRHSASGPDPASSSPNSRSLARTVVMRNGPGAVTGDTLPAVRASAARRRGDDAFHSVSRSRRIRQSVPFPARRGTCAVAHGASWGQGLSGQVQCLEARGHLPVAVDGYKMYAAESSAVAELHDLLACGVDPGHLVGSSLVGEPAGDLDIGDGSREPAGHGRAG